MKMKDIAIVLLFVVAIATCHEISGQLQGMPHVYVSVTVMIGGWVTACATRDRCRMCRTEPVGLIASKIFTSLSTVTSHQYWEKYSSWRIFAPKLSQD